MDKTVITNVMRMSLTLRTSLIWPNCIGSVRFLRHISRKYDSNSKDLSNVTEPYNSTDSLLASLQCCTSSKEILNLVRTNHSKMSNTHAITAFSSLFFLLKDRKEAVSDISKQQDFMLLCNVLNKNLKSLDIGDTLTALKTLNYLNVPATSLIVQSLLQLVRHSMNQLSLQQIIFLHFLIKSMVKTPLVEALSIALPIVFLSYLQVQVQGENITMLTQVLRYLSSIPHDENVVFTVVNEIKKCGPITDLRMARSILWSLCDCKYIPPDSSNMVHSLQNFISTKLDELTSLDITKILSRVSFKINRGHMEFYNQAFIDAIAKNSVTRNFNFVEGIHILKSLNFMGYVHMDLLEHLIRICINEPNILLKHDQFYITQLIKGLCIADYKPLFWNSLQEVIIKNEILPRETSICWVQFCINLASLDCFSSKFLELAFTQTKFNEYNIIPRFTLLLYQAVKTLYPTYNGTLPSESALQLPDIKQNEYPLLSVLQKALGGSQYVGSGLKTKLGHQIDHAVVMRKGGYPVAINCENNVNQNNSENYLEDLSIPSESEVILILGIPSYGYAINCPRLKGTWTLYLKTIETYTTHTVVPINISAWTALPDHEKIPYLMRAITFKHDNLSAIVNGR